jgi:hypothetical protein
MRHILLPGAIATGTQRMDDAAAVARLVAPSGRALPIAPGHFGTAVGTINLTAIAAATDEHLSAATDTQKETGWRCVRAFALRTWTKSTTSEILPPHSCPARCGARCRYETWLLRSAPCLP